MTERFVKNQDIHYEKVDLENISDETNDLYSTQQKILFFLLEEFEYLFDGTLGEWDTDPVDIESKPDHKPHSARYYPFLKINKEIFK